MKNRLTIVPGNAAKELLSCSNFEQINDKEFLLGSNYLPDNRVHLFVGSNDWEELVIGLTKEMHFHIIKKMLPVFKRVTVFIIKEEEVTKDMVDFLCDVYPTKAGQLRRAFLLKKPLNTIVKGDN